MAIINSNTGKDTSAGTLHNNPNGSMSYQMDNKATQDGLSKVLGGAKLSDSFGAGGGKASLTIGGDNPEAGAIFKDLSSSSYNPDSVRDLGVRAVDSRGNHHNTLEDIQDNSIVTVGKMQATAKSLYAAGLLSKDVHGNYTLTEGGSPKKN